MKNYQFIEYQEKTSVKKPLGEILQEADLISYGQLQVVLRDQSIYTDMRIGEILALRGWLKPETADFFAEKWPKIIAQKDKQPLGQYFKEAALLDQHQINSIIREQQQQQILVRFGKMVIEKGWLKPKTVNYFLDGLSSKSASDTLFISKRVLEEIKRSSSI